ncbi:ABC-F family ATP-binding cassette domain-containing protein [uncultured Porphyromonas sp.]|jgi:ABC transporter, ATP-binding protein, putative|uniref:ABC-F family ATP-binding cassette domain-containing protein n=1 Tax=uncultured Porphyromonas sp. TaxID=159274 RepID=UPI00262C8AF4|nr:ABC-F family ATP-binding cassette domain-containing protein [uncultured Porphyromonas sp.]
MISANNVSVYFGAKPLFEDISFVISAKERIALVGKNGAGKSTLLKLLAGIDEPTEGSISRPKDIRIGYLPQVMQMSDERTVLAECQQVFSHITELEQEVERLAQEMATRTDYESDEYMELIERHAQRSDLLLMQSSGSIQADIERTLLGLGFERTDFERPTSEFSGGWRMRIELAKILLQRPDILLLDEPTNHLDIESIRWLERFIASGSSALVLISHDRAFIDATTNRTLEIELGRLYDYKTNYSHYLTLREERLEQQRRAYENQQKELQATEDFIERFRYKATKAVQVQSRLKQLAKVERIQIEDIDRKAMHFSFLPAITSGAYPVIIEGLTKSYGSHTVFSNVNMTIERGEKVAFVGKNGSGKSTLIKCIMGEISDYTGTLRLGHNVEVGYFAQTQSQELNGDYTVYETIDREAQGEIRTRINDLLGAFMFGGEESEKKVSVLSGGERGRVALIKLLLRPANLLILDEPTNHLDIRSKEVLKEAILRFSGTVIIVSHDRVFLDGLVSRVYEFRSGKVTEHIGGIYDWLEKRDQEDNTTPSTPRAGASSCEVKTTSGTTGAEDYQRQKEAAKERRALERELRSTEDRSEAIDTELQELEAKLALPEHATDQALFDRYRQLKEEQETVLTRWEELSLQLEQ